LVGSGMRAFAGVEQGRGRGPARQTPNEGYGNRSGYGDIFDELGGVAWVTRNPVRVSFSTEPTKFLLTRERVVVLIDAFTVRYSASYRQFVTDRLGGQQYLRKIPDGQ